MQRAPQTYDTGSYPGMEKEQCEPNRRLPARTPANSPLAGRQQKPGTAARQPMAALHHANGLYGSTLRSPTVKAGGVATPAASLWTDASGEPTMSMLQPIDSCDPTVEGPRAKRAKPAHSYSYGLQQWQHGGSSGGGWVDLGWSSPGQPGDETGDSDSDGDGEAAVISCKRPTPTKVPGAPAGAPAGAAIAGAPAAAATAAPPLWVNGGMYRSIVAQDALQMEADCMGPAVEANNEAKQEDEELCASGSDMEDDCFVGEWQPFSRPHPLDIEE